MDRKWWTAISVALVVTGSASAWWWFREDPQIAKVRDLSQQLFAQEGGELDEQQRREKFQELRDVARNLTDDQKMVLEEDREKRFEERMDEFFALSKEERVAYLDQRIDQMEAWRKRASERRAGAAAGGNDKSGERRRERSSASRQPSNSQQRQERSRNRLDRSTPERRAKKAEFARQFQQRMQERGITSGGRGGPGGGRSGPGGGRFGRT